MDFMKFSYAYIFGLKSALFTPTVTMGAKYEFSLKIQTVHFTHFLVTAIRHNFRKI